MIKWIILISIFLLLPTVMASELCENTPEINKGCTMVTPDLTQCTTFDYKIFDINGTVVETGDLALLEDNVYHFNITLEEGEYIIRLCDGAVREIIVKEDLNNRYFLYVTSVLIFFILLIIGYYIKDETFLIIAGMLSIVLAINLFINGFPGLTNDFLKNGIVIVLAGIGFYFVLAPTLEVIEEWRTKLLKFD